MPMDPLEVAAMQAIAKSISGHNMLGWGVKSADLCDGTWGNVRYDKNTRHVTSIGASFASYLLDVNFSSLMYLSRLDLSFNLLSSRPPHPALVALRHDHSQPPLHRLPQHPQGLLCRLPHD
ncbi:hypothetical protein E2562_011263 [Oryza meyeriana var. granulata]|uniref:Leucine-rich repeat-containing N-terminal plant-type domain-containing protein n=1 Tax=Oryza meyeriana var. granulata TaxID=110450 RepID=A0A6G1BW50_9ORYZ|nr:hypothetical protein E2562_011263 [Oryza meyeriana var. granulata]